MLTIDNPRDFMVSIFCIVLIARINPNNFGGHRNRNAVYFLR